MLFVFSGGPGASSIWTHFGILGPRQVRFADPLRPPTASPFEIGDNPHSLLDVADLVFIDPALTGYSRLLPEARADDFLGVTEDAHAIADFRRQWLTRHGRWNAPSFLVGESYGTIRAIAIAIAGMLSGGVPAAAWLQSNLRLGPAAFQSRLLQGRGQQVGAYDLRYTLAAQPSGGDPVVDDPAMGQYTPGFVAAFHEHFTKELGVVFAEPYLPIVWDRVNFKWNYGAGPGVTLPRNDAAALAVAMRRNPALQVFVAAGYYDLVTPLAAAEYALAHAPIPRERLTIKPKNGS